MLYVNPMESNPLFRTTSAEGGGVRRKAALKEFEQVFLFQLLREMRKTVPEDGIFKASPQQAYFEEMLDDFWAGQMAESGQFGIAKQIESQMAPVEKGADVAKAEACYKGISAPSAAKGLSLPTSSARGLPLNLMAQ